MRKILAESRWQIIGGGALAIFVVISLTAAVLYLPDLSTNGSTGSMILTSTNSTSGPPVTIYVSRITTTIQTATPRTLTLTVTISQTPSVTTVYKTETPTSRNSTCPILSGPGVPIYCVPLTISNSQPSPITAGTQIMLRADWQEYESYLAPNVGNVVFADASGNPVYAWCESSCSNTQSVSNVWIKEDLPIPESGQQQMFMYVFPISQIRYDALGYWGAFPIITATYGQYDNGPKVFNFYNNFNGSSLCSCLAATPFLGDSQPGGFANFSVGNGLTITATGSAQGAAYGYHIHLIKPESFSAIDSNVVDTNVPTNLTQGAAYRYTAMDLVSPAPVYPEYGFNSSYSSVDQVCSCGDSFSLHLDSNAFIGNGSMIAKGNFNPWIGVQSLQWFSTGSESSGSMELQQLRGTDSTLTYSPSYADIAFVNAAPAQYYMTFHWVRTRNVPPNDVMPLGSFGLISSYQP